MATPSSTCTWTLGSGVRCSNPAQRGTSRCHLHVGAVATVAPPRRGTPASPSQQVKQAKRALKALPGGDRIDVAVAGRGRTGEHVVISWDGAPDEDAVWETVEGLFEGRGFARRGYVRVLRQPSLDERAAPLVAAHGPDLDAGQVAEVSAEVAAEVKPGRDGQVSQRQLDLAVKRALGRRRQLHTV